MPIDRYMPCPCGTGKKIKFCCPDLLSELEHIQRMFEGEQRLACLEHVNRLLQTHPFRACLLAIKCQLELELGRFDDWGRTVALFGEKHPNNPVMLAEQAIYRAETEGVLSAIEPLERSLEIAGEHMQSRALDAVATVARLLLAAGHVIAGRAHLLLELRISKSEEALRMITRLHQAVDIPLLLKVDHPLEKPAADFSHRERFAAALEMAARGLWLRAAERFSALAAESPQVPAVWHNLALMRAFVADDAGAVEALRKLSALDIPLDDAVEAEALAQLLDAADQGAMLDKVLQTFEIADVSDAEARLAADRRVCRLSLEGLELDESDEPPPLAGFELLDRPLTTSGTGLKREDVPRVIGQLFVFGKQTDRPARLELVAVRDPSFEAAKRLLADTLGPELGEPTGEEVIDREPLVRRSLSTRWRLPDDMPHNRRRQLADEERHHVLLEVWPTLPLPALQGRSPREAANDPAMRIRLAAAVLNFEQAIGVRNPPPAEVVQELRSRLNLPAVTEIAPAEVDDLETLPAVRWHRLHVESLSDEQVVDGYQRAAIFRDAAAIVKFSAEAVRRRGLDTKVDQAEAHGLLAQFLDDDSARLHHIDKARRVATERGESCAPWDLAELAARLEAGEVDEADRVLRHLSGQHRQEPGVSEALAQLFFRLGLIGPDGKPHMAPSAPAAAAPSLVLPGDEAASPADLWTPESAVAAGGGKKSVIWTPGDP